MPPGPTTKSLAFLLLAEPIAGLTNKTFCDCFEVTACAAAHRFGRMAEALAEQFPRKRFQVVIGA
jgi:hypothetical protein